MIMPHNIRQHSQLLDMLQELELPRMADDLAGEFLESDSPPRDTQLLFDLLTRECQRRRDRRERRARREASLPYQDADLDEFICDVEANLDPRVLESLRRCEWIREHDNLIITGGPGSGKTHLVCAAANAALSCGFAVKFIRTPLLIRELSRITTPDVTRDLDKKLLNKDLLVLDDFDMLDPNTDPEPLFQFIEAVNARTSIAVISSTPIANWRLIFRERTACAAAVISRLHERSHLIELKGTHTYVHIPNCWEGCLLPF